MNTERLSGADEGPVPRFSHNFWGKDDAGYSALTTRMRHAKLTCQEILGMFQARAALEEEYGKKLLKLSKASLGKDELGSLRDSLDVVRYEIEATGKSHIELASKMRDQLENALADFNNSQKDKRKLAKEKYDAECIRTKGLSAAKMNLVGKELDKVSLKMEKTELASRAAEVCDVNQNLQSFIDASATGDETPDIPTYLNTQFKTSPGDTPADNPLLAKAQAQDMKIRTVSGPHQPLPEQDPSAPSSRRQSNYSSNEGPDGEAPPPPVDMALSIGGNVFKLDPQTVNMLSQPDENRRPIGGYPPPNPANHAPQNISPGTVKPAVENSLGISLDVAGTVKEDRFPHWQSQAQQAQQAQQAHNAYSAAGSSLSGHLYHQHPSGQEHAQSSRMMSLAPVAHSRSQTMPIQNDPSRGFISNPDATHRRSMSGAQADQSLAYQYQHQQPYQAQGMVAAMPVACGHPGQNVGMKQKSMDGKPILFYGMLKGEQRVANALSRQPDANTIYSLLISVRAIYDYEATIPEELSLKVGDILAVLHTRDDGWWEGDLLDEYRGARRGLFPSNFTEPTA
ncbi:Proline-serine-threonine phosphatase-interacting protein 2 [Podila minutissima]|uniref:Proline-serine-threonine phosphatase-interacting protein 2 n=1 Tax=Podila minutissima TaxID=64525 RepID=A0A9P5SFW0_9FUNG|nr:Proline-serine-threonine phosphatase-interacting protein 2 [Podila minutissima]